ncbi:MAG: beta-N-acetylhexosaminidase [Victivallaceae bacterium]|nr:beta-N-acetylhexosaminidase [Victivallaceae bacterium]
MKKIAFGFAAALAAVAWGAENFNDIACRVIPVPQKIGITSRAAQKLDADRVLRIASNLSEADVKKTTAALCVQYWGVAPEIVCTVGGEAVVEEGYRLDTTGEVFSIEVSSFAGLRYALSTMRQLSAPERGVEKGRGFVMPQVKIDDFPQLKFRAFHFMFANGQPLWKAERALRLAAYCKYNYFILEFWGNIKLDSHPEYAYPDAVSKADVKKLVALGKELGITLIPHFQIFGHAGCGSIAGGRHVLLDKHPEYATLFEPSGWTWCVSNPAARQYIEDCALELYEIFDRPPFFHVGGDEAYNAGSCSLCGTGEPYWKKVAAHFNYFRDLFAGKNCRILMWHDMLVRRDAPAWKGSTANGDADCDKLRAALDRDIIICYWEYRFADHAYRAPKDGVPDFPIFDFLRKDGFAVVNSGWMYDTTPALGEKAFKNGGFGIMQTTWGTLSNSMNYHTMFAKGSTSGWNPAARYEQLIDNKIFTVDILNRLVRDVNYDMKITDPALTSTL